MPGIPKVLIVMPVKVIEKFSVEDQKGFWYRVRMLFYLVKHSRPNNANVTQELPKVNDSVNPAAFCELLHVIKYVLDMKSLV